MFNHSEQLKNQLNEAFISKGRAYKPRTRYLDSKHKPVYINRLILEDSPYLLQHAHNPVDWYPWGEEAFTEAKQQNKPVFLSIGYSTCHWCHVMEEESFDNEDVAKVMNDHFICIKVDRELHPDVDTYYMTAVMIMQGQGGWPMSSFLTPDRKPFFGATYFRPGQFITLMHRVHELWHNQQTDLLEQADSFNQQVANAMAARQSLNEIGINVIDLTAQALMNHHDPDHGGFGQAPKFPNEPHLYFMLDYAVLKQDKAILESMVRTLHIQACGGIYDQIGGGFHRYATDINWLVPHFEKMLYNQANLSYLFGHAWQITGAKDFKRITTETLDYVKREMMQPDGGFYSATDADSEGEEGLFFTWDKTEIRDLLGNDADRFIELYQVTERGNFEGRNIPNLTRPLEQHTDEINVDYDTFIDQLNQCKTILLEARNKRIPPLRDDKIITAWNGMMIKAYAYIGRIMEKADYIEIACKTADYILQYNRTGNDSLARSSLDKNATVPALQEDYAYLAEGLLEIYDATADHKWLQHAQQLSDEMNRRFLDSESGGYFMSEQDGKSLLPYAPKEIQDNAIASGNSVALKLLTRLWRRTGMADYQAQAQQLVRTFSDDVTQRPYICSYLIDGLIELLAGEQSDLKWCCEGHVCIKGKAFIKEDSIDVTLEINIDKDWHLNDLDTIHVPVQIESDDNLELLNFNYPGSEKRQLGFQDEPVDVYEDTLLIHFQARRNNADNIAFPNTMIKFKLALQACNNERCLAPEQTGLILFT